MTANRLHLLTPTRATLHHDAIDMGTYRVSHLSTVLAAIGAEAITVTAPARLARRAGLLDGLGRLWRRSGWVVDGDVATGTLERLHVVTGSVVLAPMAMVN